MADRSEYFSLNHSRKQYLQSCYNTIKNHETDSDWKAIMIAALRIDQKAAYRRYGKAQLALKQGDITSAVEHMRWAAEFYREYYARLKSIYST